MLSGKPQPPQLSLLGKNFLNERRGLGVQGWGAGCGELVNGYLVSVWEDKKVLEIDGSDGCATLWIFLMPLNRTLKKWLKQFIFTACKSYHNKREKMKGAKLKSSKISSKINSARNLTLPPWKWYHSSKLTFSKKALKKSINSNMRAACQRLCVPVGHIMQLWASFLKQ